MKSSTEAARTVPHSGADRLTDTDVNSGSRVPAQDPVMKSSDRLLTVQDLADYLDVPVATIYAWRYRRQGPPGFRIGRHLRFRWSDIERWIEDRIGTTGHE